MKSVIKINLEAVLQVGQGVAADVQQTVVLERELRVPRAPAQQFEYEAR